MRRCFLVMTFLIGWVQAWAALFCNVASRWLGASLEKALHAYVFIVNVIFLIIFLLQTYYSLDVLLSYHVLLALCSRCLTCLMCTVYNIHNIYIYTYIYTCLVWLFYNMGLPAYDSVCALSYSSLAVDTPHKIYHRIYWCGLQYRVMGY